MRRTTVTTGASGFARARGTPHLSMTRPSRWCICSACISQGSERSCHKRKRPQSPARPSNLPGNTRGEMASTLLLLFDTCGTHSSDQPASQPAPIWATFAGVVGSSALPSHLPSFASCSYSCQCPACYPGLMPPLSHTWRPHLSPAGYGAARARIRHAWRCHTHGL